MSGLMVDYGAGDVTMNKATLMRRAAKIICLVAILAMAFLSLQVIIGLTSFYTIEVAVIRVAAFAAVVVIPIVVGIFYAVINRRIERLGLSLCVTLGALACDLILISFANGRL